MGIVINWKETVNSVFEGITDYENVELLEEEYEELYEAVENDLGEYNDVKESDVESAINIFLISKGYDYNDDNCTWEIA